MGRSPQAELEPSRRCFHDLERQKVQPDNLAVRTVWNMFPRSLLLFFVNLKRSNRVCEKMKVLVTGAAGQLGYDVCKVLTARQIEHRGVDITDFDITDQNAVNQYLKAYQPDAVIHCSAWDGGR